MTSVFMATCGHVPLSSLERGNVARATVMTFGKRIWFLTAVKQTRKRTVVLGGPPAKTLDTIRRREKAGDISRLFAHHNLNGMMDGAQLVHKSSPGHFFH